MHTNIKNIITLTALCVATTAFAQERVYVIDQRGDVVINGYGQCWRTGSWTPASAALDPAGCVCDKSSLPASACQPPAAPAALVKPVADKVIIGADALFDFDKAVLREDGKSKLDLVVARTKQINLEVVLAVGHTDWIGSKGYNQKLSERRAQAVKAYLVSKGVPADRVHASGMGELQPVATNCKGVTPNRDLISCLQPDRRVEVEVIGTK